MKLIRITLVAIASFGVMSQQDIQVALSETNVPGTFDSAESSGNVMIEKEKNRMKASISSVDRTPKDRKPNFIYRGFEAVAHGIYSMAKIVVAGWGEGTDFLIRLFQGTTHRAYDTSRHSLLPSGKKQ